MGKLSVANSVTLATRVRAEIMWGMVRQFGTPERQLYVTSFGVAPRLHSRQKGDLNDTFSLSFGDALLRFGKDVKKEYMDGAYRLAGRAFGKLMTQHFVVLGNSYNSGRLRQNQPPPTIGNSDTGGWYFWHFRNGPQASGLEPSRHSYVIKKG